MNDIPIVPVISLILVAILYVRGLKHTRDRTRPFAFAGAWLALVIALASPLHPIGEEYLSVHMVQHVVLMAIAAPLLVWSTPVATLLRALPLPAREVAVTSIRAVAPMRRRLSGTAIACALQAAVLWIWHMPGLYQASVRHDWVHALQHSSLLVVAVLFWSSIPLRGNNQLRLLTGIASLFATTLQMGILSALLTFSRLPWYRVYVTHASAAALADQQLAGLIMWVPGAIPYIAVALTFVWRTMRVRPAVALRTTEYVSPQAVRPT